MVTYCIGIFLCVNQNMIRHDRSWCVETILEMTNHITILSTNPHYWHQSFMKFAAFWVLHPFVELHNLSVQLWRLGCTKTQRVSSSKQQKFWEPERSEVHGSQCNEFGEDSKTWIRHIRLFFSLRQRLEHDYPLVNRERLLLPQPARNHVVSMVSNWGVMELELVYVLLLSQTVPTMRNLNSYSMKLSMLQLLELV